MIRTLYWENNRLFLLDQTKLPHTIEYVECRTYTDVIDGIKTMKVRGAPAIGVSAAYGMALGELAGEDLDVIGDEIKSARPTAVNLFWAVDKVLDLVSRGKSAVDVAIEMEKDDVAINKKIGEYGNSVIDDDDAQKELLTQEEADKLQTGFTTIDQ